ncbi:MAG: VWA domain-containing protein, partial [Deltaproteobacteria bacterium]|nr:VWA domain-containing protein [Deltaproteobacteria bacterium]
MNCREIQDLLAEDVEVATKNPEIGEHIKGCASCRKLLGQLHEVNAALCNLPKITVPPALIWKTTDAVEAKKGKSHRLLKWALVSGIPVLLLLLLSFTFGAIDEIRGVFSTSANSLSGNEKFYYIPADPANHRQLVDSPVEQKEKAKETDKDAWEHNYRPPRGHATVETLLSGERTKALRKRRESTTQVIRLPGATNLPESEEQKRETDIAGLDEEKTLADFGEDESRGKGKDLDADMVAAVKLIENTDGGDTYIKADTTKQAKDTLILSRLRRDQYKTGLSQSSNGGENDRNKGEQDSKKLPRQDLRSLRSDVGKLIGDREGITIRQIGDMLVLDGRAFTFEDYHRIGEIADLLPQVKSLVKLNPNAMKAPDSVIMDAEPPDYQDDGTEIGQDLDKIPLHQLEFIPAQGYFANTYLPGDPSVAWLQRKLEKEIPLHGQELTLERACSPYLQPFDAPTTDGLDVFLSSDHVAVEGPTRLTLQVGLKGSLRHAKRRAPLNAAVVIDLRAVPKEQNRRLLWMIADAIVSNQQAGDQFSLVVAGVKKPLRVMPNRFDLVTVRRSLAQAFHDMEESGGGESLQAALEVAYRKVGGEGANDAPLGANLVLLVTAAPLGSGTEAMQTLAHRQALLGINLTAIGVGNGADMEGLGALALAGQGRRRLIVDGKQTRSTVETELSASGRVVARALRLRIRLGEGVKLIEILGSHPLDAVRTERVRESEHAIDQRVANTLGIKADRGDDEDGIQIVIPAYYAGDDHVVLLDVMVPGPGKVADVRLRYKDLVRLRNSVASASLDLDA